MQEIPDNYQYVVLGLIIMVAVTYLPRILPIVLLRGKITNPFFLAFLEYVPFAVISVLLFPSIFHSTGSVYASIAGTVVALILAWRGRPLIGVAAGAACTSLLFDIIFLHI